jgi:hypothetical protein
MPMDDGNDYAWERHKAELYTAEQRERVRHEPIEMLRRVALRLRPDGQSLRSLPIPGTEGLAVIDALVDALDERDEAWLHEVLAQIGAMQAELGAMRDRRPIAIDLQDFAAQIKAENRFPPKEPTPGTGKRALLDELRKRPGERIKMVVLENVLARAHKEPSKVTTYVKRLVDDGWPIERPADATGDVEGYVYRS